MIIIFILVTIIFIGMTAFPFLLALGIPKEEQGTLVVRRNNRKDPYYFVRSFKEIMEKALELGPEDGFLQLSKPEQFAYLDEVQGKVVDKLVIGRKDFVGKKTFVFEKEIYSKYSVVLAECTQARAVAAERLRLKRHCQILRWCDGTTEVCIEPECDLGVSATSGSYLQVMENCTFQRLYGPQVDIVAEVKGGQPARHVTDQEGTIEIPKECKTAERNVRMISEKSVIKGDIITKYPLCIKEGARIFGHIKSRKSIYVEKDVVIDGNVFADASVVLQEKCHVTGDVFSQQDVYVGPCCVIGQKGKIKSVVAKSNIILSEEVTMFGYIGCDNRGRTMLRGEFEQLPQIHSNEKDMVK